VDDDCDGLTDEPDQVGGDFVNLCDDGNPCSDDLCAGQGGCSHSVVESGECMDGDACTAGDHCDKGVCVGTPVTCDDGNPCTDEECDGAGGCKTGFNTADCDDGNACTVADECSMGTCAGFDVQCDCASNADCAALEDGNQCNGTLVCDFAKIPYQCKVDPDSVVECAQPGGPAGQCQASVCDPATGQCGLVPADEGALCDDQDACTVGDVCSDGQCAAGPEALCADNNPCTVDVCNPKEGCVYAPVAAACNDGDVCTTGDQCVEGDCLGGDPLDCDDGNLCTDDSCNKATGCVHKPNKLPCDDGNACTAGDACSGGQCLSVGMTPCDDGNLCTTDGCDPVLGCTFKVNTAACDDGDPCTSGDKCSMGACKGGVLLQCSDGNPCTLDSCDAALGCVFKAVDGLDCDDGNACTTGDKCSKGTCAGTVAKVCDDGNVCTTDTCAPLAGCTYAPNTAPCDDGDLCTVGDLCALGACKGGKPLKCNDGNGCTDDGCDPVNGCQFVPNAAACSDSNACTVGDQCKAGACVPGTGSLTCDDGNGCTDDGCAPDAGCTHTANAKPCDDSNQCTVGDACSQSSCKAGAPKVCPDDGNTCTQELCDPAQGCIKAVAPNCCGNGIVEAGELCDDGNQVAGDACPADCKTPGVYAFGEFRPAMKCADFKYNGPDYRQYCFDLKGKTFCTGNNSGAFHKCEDIAGGIRFTFDYPQTWPMRFTQNTADCRNYHPDHLKNFANAVGYANFQVEQWKTGNHCERTWLDANGNFQMIGGDGNAQLPFTIKYWN
jgi:cysteine-rich repeat protein